MILEKIKVINIKVFFRVFYIYGFFIFIGLFFLVMHKLSVETNLIIGVSGLIGHTIGLIIFKDNLSIFFKYLLLGFLAVILFYYFNFSVIILGVLLVFVSIALLISYLLSR